MDVAPYLKRSRIEEDEKREAVELLLVVLLTGGWLGVDAAEFADGLELLSRLKKELVRLVDCAVVVPCCCVCWSVFICGWVDDVPDKAVELVGTLVGAADDDWDEREEDEIFCEIAEKADAAKLLALAWAFDAY